MFEEYKNLWVFVETEENKAKGVGYELLNPGEKMTFKVAVWVEYDEVDYEALFDGAPWNAADYNILITMNATQDVDGALSR